MDRFSNQWFESRTWRAQAEAYGRLLDAPAGASLAELVATFGEAGRAGELTGQTKALGYDQ